MKIRDTTIESIAFSIVIPVYNEEKYIREAIDSVINQTYKNWELVIIDDGSNDKTSSICKSYDPSKVKYFYQENQGPSAARNNGVRKSKSKYICFLDGDDYFHPNHLKILSTAIEAQGKPEAIFRTEWIDIQKSEQIRVGENHKKVNQNPGRYFLSNTPVIHTMCFHRNIFDYVRFADSFFTWEDVHLLARATARYPFYQIHGFTAYYRRYIQKEGKKSIIQNLYKNYFTEIEHIEDLEKNYYEEIRNNISKCDIKLAKFLATLNFGYIALANKDKGKAWFAYKECKKYCVSFLSYLRLFKLGCAIILRSL